MPRYKPYDYDQLLMVPVSLDHQLMPGTLEYAIHQLIEERIDTSGFDEKYSNDETGRTAYDPKVLLKIVLFAYARGMLHSRPIERACKENITFMALACGQKPDHSTIAAFVSSMGAEQNEETILKTKSTGAPKPSPPYHRKPRRARLPMSGESRRSARGDGQEDLTPPAVHVYYTCSNIGGHTLCKGS